jgi:dGTPase
MSVNSSFTNTEGTAANGYMQLDPEVEAAIIEMRTHGGTSEFAVRDSDVLRREDLPHDRATLARPAYMRDVEKIVNVPAYNRYAGKTQVFSFVDNDDITRRGLHVQLVDRVARGIGRLLGLNIDLIEAISLGHDVGHTPFGHAGERFLSKCYFERTGLHFNHNVHSVRVLDVLFPRNVSLQTLDGVLCHNGEFACQHLELGTTDTFDKLDAAVELCTRDESEIKHLRPSTLEGCVVRVSDMIAYIGKDRQDAIGMGILHDLEAFDSKVIGRTNAQIINNLTVDIVNNSFGRDRISMSREVYEDLKAAKRQNFEVIYNREGMIDNTSNIVEEMFEEMYTRHLDDLTAGCENSAIFRHHIDSLANKSASIDRDKYLQLDPNQIVVDYMASMTDDYFMSLYEYLFPSKRRDIPVRDYCAGLRAIDAAKALEDLAG